MLKTIRLKNFKLHEDTSIEAAPITVFIGPNNSGKSSIFQALLALRQAAVRGNNVFCQPLERNATSQEEPYLFPGGELVDLGDFNQVVRRGHQDLELELAGNYAHDTSKTAFPPVNVEFRVTIRENNLVAHSGSLDTGPYGLVRWEWMRGMQPGSPPQPLSVGSIQVDFSSVGNFSLIAVAGYIPPRDSPPQAMTTASLVGQRLGETIPRFLRSLHPIFPVRGFEEWGYPLPAFRPSGLELISLPDRALALAALLAYNRNLEEEVSKRLEDLLGIQIRYELVPPKKVTIWAKAAADQKPGTLFANEGTGANQLPFILVPVALAQPKETILLSEPEVHLHPKKQCELTRMLLTVAKKENIQFFIETHSEHVLHTILNAVARGEWSPADVALYYFAEPKNGIAEVGKREINQFGQVDGGLPGFFEQSLTELTDYLKALSKP
jgi:energy-coupling factor transporter ATP-binding protein EcfA2